MSDLLNKIRQAQVIAGENAVIRDLQEKGLVPKDEKNVTTKELLDIIIVLQKRLEMLINLTPTGKKRNRFTEENINAVELINRTTNQTEPIK